MKNARDALCGRSAWKSEKACVSILCAPSTSFGCSIGGKNVSTPCRHEPICSHVVDFLAGLLDSSQQGAPRIGLYLPPQNHAKRRILCQYTICRNPACLIDLTAIPDGHCRNSVGPDRRNLHFLRDLGTRHPYIRVTVSNLVALWVRECSSCGDDQYR